MSRLGVKQMCAMGLVFPAASMFLWNRSGEELSAGSAVGTAIARAGGVK
jgi:hypothetical protein